MRVDTAGGRAEFGDLDALSRLKGYVSALRRRWYIVVVPVIVLGALGLLTSPSVAGPAPILVGKRYYQATHVLIDETQGSSTGTAVPVNLSQAAYLVNTGEVPETVAKKLDIPLDEVASSVIGFPRAQVVSVEVQAVGTDPDRVIALADASADELLVVLLARAQKDFDTQRDRVLTQLGQLNDDISELNDQIAADPPNRSQLDAQQRSLNNQYSLVYEKFTQLANAQEPSAGLTSIEGAKAISITEKAYERTRKTIRERPDYVTGDQKVAVAEESSAVAGTGEGASPATRAIVGGLTGLAIGLGLVLLLDRYDSRLRRRVDVQAATGWAVVAEIPPLTRNEQRGLEVVAHTKPRSRAAEAYRVVRGSILFKVAADGKKVPGKGDALVLMVTSANPAEGKTTTVANLATVLAEGGFSVLVVNCDFRRPQVHRYLLSDPLIAANEGTRIGPVHVVSTLVDRVKLITGLGEQDSDVNPLEVVAMQRKIIRTTRSEFDVILLDTAPFLTTNDASELLAEADQVLFVVRGGKTKVEAARRTAEILERFGAPVLGVVMNDSDDSPASDYYYAYAAERSGRGRRNEAPAAQPPPVVATNGRGADEAMLADGSPEDSPLTPRR